MGKYTGIIIVSDVDGTFWSKVPENYAKNIEAIERFKAGGGIFTFATGRDLQSLKGVIPEAEDIANAPLIVANGSKLYDAKTGEYIVDEGLNMPLFREFIKLIMKKYPGIGVRFSGSGIFMVPDLNEIIRSDVIADSDKKLFQRVKEIPLDEINGVSKCVIVHNPEILDEVKKIGEDFDGGRNFYFSKSYARGLEVVNKDFTKGKTTRKLKEEYLNIPNSVLYAIGDYDNDIDMILSADVGVCPENAVDSLKDVAKIITKSCADGAIADLIEIISN